MMAWVKMVNGEIVETTSRQPAGARRLDTLEWVTPSPDADAAVLEPCGWYEVAKTSAPIDGFAYSGAWAVDADTGRPVWQWTKGDALPTPPTPIPVDPLPEDEVAGSLALLTQDAIEAKSFAAEVIQILVGIGVPQARIDAGLAQAKVVATERLKRYEDEGFRREQIAGRIKQARQAGLEDEGPV